MAVWMIMKLALAVAVWYKINKESLKDPEYYALLDASDGHCLYELEIVSYAISTPSVRLLLPIVMS